MKRDRLEYWRGEICEAVYRTAKHESHSHIDFEINSLITEVTNLLEKENARLEDLIYDILTEIPETYLTGYSDWGDELKRLEQEELLKANKGD